MEILKFIDTFIKSVNVSVAFWDFKMQQTLTNLKAIKQLALSMQEKLLHSLIDLTKNFKLN